MYNNTHNQVINQLSIRPSNSPELELFKQHLLNKEIISKINNDTINLSNESKESANESVKSINGHLNKASLMYKDKLKLFLNELYNKETNEFNQQSDQKLNQSSLNDQFNNQVNKYLDDENSSAFSSEGNVFYLFFSKNT